MLGTIWQTRLWSQHIRNYISEVNEFDILEIVHNFKDKKSADWTEIDMSLVKNIIVNIVKPLTYICNQSFQSGIFPSKMKTAKVIPIFKNGDRHLFNNYRPISLLSQFSKILEKLFVKRLDSFIEKHNLLSNHQYGFRGNRSTSMAVMELVEEVSTAIENGDYTVGVFIDLKKAFDTIDHNLLLNKLEKYGVRGIANSWIKSYLEDRYQYVQLNNVKSELERVTFGVPQGSVLGPKLFILYINDICKVSKILKYVLFADDTNLYCSGKSLEQLLNVVEGELKSLKTWFDINKLSLNLTKTKFIIFGTRKKNHKATIKISGMEIERVYENKFLGVIIDDKLCWKSHINNVKLKMSKTIAILYKTKYLFCQKAQYLLYCSLIVPHITYCVEVWGNAYKSNTNPIFLLQKRAIRIINRSDYCEPTNKLFIKYNTLKFHDIVAQKTVLLAFKAQQKSLPCCIQKLFQIKENRYDLRGKLMFEITTARTNIKKRCTSIMAREIWNSCDNDLKMCWSIYNFKKTFKNNILNKYKTILL